MGELAELPPYRLDQRIAQAARALRKAHVDLRGEGPDKARDPLRSFRDICTRTLYRELCERADDPFLAGARDWVAFLTIERVTWGDAVRAARALHDPRVEIERPERLRASMRTLQQRFRAETSEERRALWGEALALGAPPLADAARILVERRAAAMEQLDRLDREGFEVPSDPPEAAQAVAESVLAMTDDVFDASREWTETIGRSLARSADRGWPPRLSLRWIHDLFARTDLAGGLDLDLGPLPETLGGTSFARALAQFGAAFARAALPGGAPFVLANLPYDLREARRAALFGGLAADPCFGVRGLGLTRDRARDQAREMARALVISLRLDAARVLLRSALLLPVRDQAPRFEEISERALGKALPTSLLGVLPRLSAGDATRLFGAVLAARDRRSLIEDFEEDWFRNPRAAEAIRDEQSRLSAEPRVTRACLDEALVFLNRSLREIAA